MRSLRDIKKSVANVELRSRFEVNQAILEDLIQELDRLQTDTPASFMAEKGRSIMKNPLMRLAVAAALVVAACFGVRQLGGSLDGASVAWADVAERFESVAFFHLTIYLGHDESEQAHKIEIWKSETSLVRAHEGNKVLFANMAKGKTDIFNLTEKNEGVVAFDRSTKQPVAPDGAGRMFLGLLCPKGRFSLNTLMNSVPADTTIDVMETADTPASKETVLFEARHKSTPERMLIWGLRASRLPVRLRFIDPRNNECADFLFDYSQGKPATFFDPNAFTSGRED
jgi:hypothetical protein